MRLIDADSLKNTLEYGLLCNIPADSKDSENEKINTWIQDVIDKEPTVTLQEPAIDKIRAEIETKYGQCDICKYFVDYDYNENDISEYRPMGDIADILQIIDKYKSESED